MQFVKMGEADFGTIVELADPPSTPTFRERLQLCAAFGLQTVDEGIECGGGVHGCGSADVLKYGEGNVGVAHGGGFSAKCAKSEAQGLGGLMLAIGSAKNRPAAAGQDTEAMNILRSCMVLSAAASEGGFNHPDATFEQRTERPRAIRGATGRCLWGDGARGGR